MGRRIVAVAVGTLVFLMASGNVSTAAAGPGPGDAVAARAVTALVDRPATAANALPPDFAALMGYRPELLSDDGADTRVLARPDGSCSSPLGDTSFDFGTACRRHDLGYDLLRHAERRGTPLGPWARRAVDRAFDEQLHARCGSTACRVLADVYARSVDLNSIRQRYATPLTETGMHWVTAGAAGLLVVLLALGLAGNARRVPLAVAR